MHSRQRYYMVCDTDDMIINITTIGLAFANTVDVFIVIVVLFSRYKIFGMIFVMLNVLVCIPLAYHFRVSLSLSLSFEVIIIIVFDSLKCLQTKKKMSRSDTIVSEIDKIFQRVPCFVIERYDIHDEHNSIEIDYLETMIVRTRNDLFECVFVCVCITVTAINLKSANILGM